MESGDRYSGSWQRGKRHGNGSCIFVNGDKFCGQWAGDLRSGQGTCEYANGDTYQGKLIYAGLVLVLPMLSLELALENFVL